MNSVATSTPAPSAGSPRREPERGRLRGALRNAFVDGALSSFTTSVVDNFATAAILALGAGNKSVALLAGVAALVSALAQLFSPRLTAAAASRRTLVVRCAWLQAAACLLFAAAGFAQSPGFLRYVFGLREVPAHLPLAAVALAIGGVVLAYAAYSVAGSISQGAWASWMSDLVPRSSRGRHFSWRAVWIGGIYGASTLIIGYAFRGIWGPGASAPWLAFAIIFAAAGVMRFLAASFASRQYEPKAEARVPARDFTYWQFLSRTGRSNFATFAVCLATLSAGSTLAGAFFPVYFLRDLKGVPVEGFVGDTCALVARLLAAAGIGNGEFRLAFDLSTFAVLPFVGWAVRLLFARFWGRVADRWGNVWVMRICALLASLCPLCYLGEPRFTLMLLAWVIGGIGWGGMDLASLNYAMEAVTPPRRVRCISYLNATVGIATAAFAFAGGLLAEHLPPLCGYRMQSLFLLSGVLRFLPALALILLIREVRPNRPPFSVEAMLGELPGLRQAAEFLRAMARPAGARGDFARP
jgi:MFS family permease